eukprot:7718102-Pyramimonas_sp.AAC.1
MPAKPEPPFEHWLWKATRPRIIMLRTSIQHSPWAASETSSPPPFSSSSLLPFSSVPLPPLYFLPPSSLVPTPPRLSLSRFGRAAHGA